MSAPGYRRIHQELMSGDVDRTLDALFLIGGRTDTPPPPEVVACCNRLMRHFDEDVRIQSIMAVGVHWASSMSLDSLLEVASLDDLVEVRTAAVRALTRYAESKKEDVCRVLAKIAAEPSEEPGLRAVAYIGLLRAEGLITAREKASLPQDIGSLEVDERLLRRWV